MRQRASIGSTILGLCATLGLASCGDHVVVVELSNLATDATTVSAYYRIDSDSYRASSLQSGQFQPGSPSFGIRPPSGRGGTMTVQVLAYKNNVPCALSKGSATVDVSGQGKLSATAALDAGAAAPGCSANDAPVKYPSDARVWAAAKDNVWIVGKDAAVLRWDGSLFREVVIPSTVLGGKTPTFRAVHGDSQGNVWIVGEANSVIRFDPNGTPSAVPTNLVSSNAYEMTYTGVHAAQGSVWLSAFSPGLADGFIGNYTAATNKLTTTQLTKLLPPIVGDELHAVDCSSATDCWFVGAAQTVVHLTGGSAYAKVTLSNDTSCGAPPSDFIIRSVYAHATISSVKMVGEYNNMTPYFISHNGKCFFQTDKDSQMNVIPTVPLSLHGRSPDNLVVVGPDAMYRWRTNGLTKIPGIDKTTWQSVSTVPSGFFAVSKGSMIEPSGRVYYVDLP